MAADGLVAGVAESPCPPLRVALALVRGLSLYWLFVFPRARRELRGWRERAARIPDPVIRRTALVKLRSERLVAEGAAAFAILARLGRRSCVVRACVAYEVMYDLLDALGESPAADVLANNRCLHRALLAAVTPGLPVDDYYAEHPGGGDGGYLRDLVLACRQALERLPGHRAAVPALRRFAARAAEAQSLNHAGLAANAAPNAGGGVDAHWWELAAAASDPLGIHALLAAASDCRLDLCTATALERAYYPWIGALTWLLESLVDQQEDAVTGNQSYVSHYASRRHAADRLGVIASHAAAEAAGLPKASGHTVLLAGVVSLYLSDPHASEDEACDAAAAVRRGLGSGIELLLLVLRLRRAAGR